MESGVKVSLRDYFKTIPEGDTTTPLSTLHTLRKKSQTEEKRERMITDMKFNLQHFADAGTLVNATGNFVNANTGATTAFDNSHSLSAELKAFYDTELLENARAELFYAQFAKRQPLPANHHGSVEWRKWNTFDRAAKLTEGVIPTGQKFGVTAVTGSVDQYGTYTAITDKLELRAYDDVILGATEEMGASAAETQEALIRDALTPTSSTATRSPAPPALSPRRPPLRAGLPRTRPITAISPPRWSTRPSPL